jgi:hypothetical protein
MVAICSVQQWVWALLRFCWLRSDARCVVIRTTTAALCTTTAAAGTTAHRAIVRDRYSRVGNRKFGRQPLPRPQRQLLGHRPNRSRAGSRRPSCQAMEAPVSWLDRSGLYRSRSVSSARRSRLAYLSRPMTPNLAQNLQQSHPNCHPLVGQPAVLPKNRCNRADRLPSLLDSSCHGCAFGHGSVLGGAP